MLLRDLFSRNKVPVRTIDADVEAAQQEALRVRGLAGYQASRVLHGEIAVVPKALSKAAATPSHTGAVATKLLPTHAERSDSAAGWGNRGDVSSPAGSHYTNLEQDEMHSAQQSKDMRRLVGQSWLTNRFGHPPGGCEQCKLVGQWAEARFQEHTAQHQACHVRRRLVGVALLLLASCIYAQVHTQRVHSVCITCARRVHGTCAGSYPMLMSCAGAAMPMPMPCPCPCPAHAHALPMPMPCPCPCPCSCAGARPRRAHDGRLRDRARS